MYTYLINHDGAYRPVNLTGEGLALVDLVQYNAAGAMTSFGRRDTQFGVVTNTYQFNSLYQMTNQTVTRGGTTLQNLSYAYPATQNNGQIASQTNTMSGETVEYQYDELNRLISAATPGGGGWGLSFAYDGFGNRTNQAVTKGSGPMHSVAINPANNRISTSGYSYDANGNMTAMPLMTASYDVANRMVESVHQTAGTHRYGYNHANQRVFRHTSVPSQYSYDRRFSLYGLAGELLIESEWMPVCQSGCGAPPQGERLRYVYFGGRKMFASVYMGPLKATTPNRLESRSEHFPYGEQKGASPPDNDKDYFTTYRRDESGLDYAWNRYYSPTMGRFTTADPYGGSAVAGDPQSWNRYAYVGNDPVGSFDPEGLQAVCPPGDVCISIGQPPIRTGRHSPGGGGWGEHPIGDSPLQKQNEEAEQEDAKAVHRVEWSNVGCGLIPDGIVHSISGSAGAMGANTGSLEVLINLNTLEVSLFASGGMSGGVTGGVSGSVNSALVYNLGESNTYYSGGSSGGSASVPLGPSGISFGLFASWSSDGLPGLQDAMRQTATAIREFSFDPQAYREALQPLAPRPGGSFSVGASVGSSWLSPPLSGSLNATNYTSPGEVGFMSPAQLLQLDPAAYFLYNIKQRCR